MLRRASPTSPTLGAVVSSLVPRHGTSVPLTHRSAHPAPTPVPAPAPAPAPAPFHHPASAPIASHTLDAGEAAGQCPPPLPPTPPTSPSSPIAAGAAFPSALPPPPPPPSIALPPRATPAPPRAPPRRPRAVPARAVSIRAAAASAAASAAARRARDRPEPAGFWNMAQSCHLGATLTALAALPSMQAWARDRDSVVADALRASAAGARRALDPRPAAEAIHSDGWSARDAQDAHETLGRLLDVLQHGEVGGARWHRPGCRRGDDAGAAGIFLASAGLAAEAAAEGDAAAGAAAGAVGGRVLPRPRVAVGPAEAAATAGSTSPSLQLPPPLAEAPPPPPPLCGWSAVVRSCVTCGASSDAILHTFAMLSLPLPTSNRTLSRALLDAFASTDTGIEAHCDMCGTAEPHTRQHSIARFPPVLALHLQKAYLTSGDSISASRHATFFPEELTLPRGNPIPPTPKSRSSFCSDRGGEAKARNGVGGGGTIASPDNPEPTRVAGGGTVRYGLRSVVQHYGGSGSSGHFVAVVGGGEGTPADGLAGLCGGRWWIVDDGRVSRCQRSVALNPLAAYLLFYERDDSSDS